MDARVLRHFGGDITRANIQPSRRDRILRKYGAAPSAGAAPEVAA
jgi:alkane 1-monooxygenase